MRRITYCTPDGRWGIENIPWDEIDHRLYGALMKLKRYEDTGLSPDELKKQTEANEERIWS